jgi:hypothetical protein
MTMFHMTYAFDCDAIKLCRDNLCCSQFNWCGSGDAWCGTGCLSGKYLTCYILYKFYTNQNHIKKYSK